jgi:hypothetical protein
MMQKPFCSAKVKMALPILSSPIMVSVDHHGGAVVRLTPSRWILSLLPALALLAGGAGAQTPKLQLGGYEQSLRLMEQGECARAQEKLMPNGRPAPGDEVAMSDLGSCYLRAAAKKTDAETADRWRETGAGLILIAANTGVRQAQEEMVRLYLDDKLFFRDPYEAAKWYSVWQANRSQMHFGQIEFDAALVKQMNSSFTPDQWAEGKARAERWHQTSLSAQSTAP